MTRETKFVIVATTTATYKTQRDFIRDVVEDLLVAERFLNKVGKIRYHIIQEEDKNE